MFHVEHKEYILNFRNRCEGKLNFRSLVYLLFLLLPGHTPQRVLQQTEEALDG
jgi:hypothetical protein